MSELSPAPISGPPASVRRSKKGAEAPSEKSQFGHADHLVARDNEVIEEADPDEV